MTSNEDNTHDVTYYLSCEQITEIHAFILYILRSGAHISKQAGKKDIRCIDPMFWKFNV